MDEGSFRDDFQAIQLFVMSFLLFSVGEDSVRMNQGPTHLELHAKKGICKERRVKKWHQWNRFKHSYSPNPA